MNSAFLFKDYDGMDTPGSNGNTIATMLNKLREGDEQAAFDLWERFFHQLLSHCRLRLRPNKKAIRDEEDIVLSAMKSFCFGLRRGQFPDLVGEENLWRLLMTIVMRKIADNHQHQSRRKRDQSRTQSLTDAFVNGDSIASLIDREMSPELAAECSEEVEQLIGSLQHEDLKSIAVMKMEGFTNQEIAHQIRCSLTSIERKLRTIREIWGQSQ
jgi:DNA-directed RNA polymerase specialized sigma24 family protein